MPEKHVYVLGINVYDHDVSACLLRDGEIAFVISKDDVGAITDLVEKVD